MTDAPELLAKHESIENGLLVYLQGEIEFSKTPYLRTNLIALLEEQKPKRLIIDLSHVPYMDSSGIATIVEVLQWQRRDGNSLVLIGLQDKVYSMLEITRLDQLFTIADNLDAAKKL